MAARIDEELRLSDEATISHLNIVIAEGTGAPYSIDYFGKCFGTVRAAAHAARPDLGCDTLLARALRHTAVTRLAEAGCEIPQIAAVTGHSLAQAAAIVDRYMTRTRKLGDQAGAKRLAEEPRHALAGGRETQKLNESPGKS